MLAELTGENVRVGLLVYRLRRRSFGGLFILLAALSLIPGISLFTGILMIVPALQMAIGLRAPIFPRIISERVIGVDQLKIIGVKVIPWVEHIERYVKPRWLVLTLPPVNMAVGIVIFILAVIVAIPLPFSNFLPSMSLLFLALGILGRDGMLIAVGLIVAVIALSVGGLIILLAVDGIGSLLKNSL